MVPRSAVQWDEDRTCCRVVTRRGQELREVKLGKANYKYCEVLQGLTPGEVVVE